MRSEQEKRQFVRTELRHLCNGCEWRRLICCSALLLACYDMAAGAPTLCNSFAFSRISRKGWSWSKRNERATPDEEHSWQHSIWSIWHL
jgi:hypothetical protein